MKNYLSSNLVFLRKMYRVSQASLASQLNKGQTTVGNWENNLTQPSVEDLLIIKHYFAISLDNLIETDLMNVKASELSGIVKKAGFVEGNVKGNVKGKVKKSYNYDTSDRPESVVNEDATTAEWATMKVLKEMDGKIDRLLLLAANKPGSGTT